MALQKAIENPVSIDIIRKEVEAYKKEGRTTAFGGGTKLPEGTTDKPATLTGNYQNIEYNDGDDKVLTLAELKCGSIYDTTAVNHSDKRLVAGTKVLVSVVEVKGQMRNRIKFA